MGEIRKIACGSCGSSWELLTGCGLGHGLLENVVSAFSEEMRKEILDSMTDMEIPLYDFSYHAADCEYCYRIVSVPVFTPMEKKSFIGGCPVCGHEVKLIQNMEEAVCPVCGKKALREEEMGLWD